MSLIYAETYWLALKTLIKRSIHIDSYDDEPMNWMIDSYRFMWMAVNGSNNEEEEDEYLTFEERNGYTEGVLDKVFYENKREMIYLRYYMKQKRIWKISQQTDMIEYLRKELKTLRERGWQSIYLC